MDRKSTMIVCAAGGLVAAAALLGGRQQSVNASSGSGGVRPDPKPEPGAMCGVKAASRTTTEVAFGTLRGGLSAGKVIAGGNGEMYVAYELDAKDVAGEKRQPVNLAIVIDRSGSMAQEQKLVQAKNAAKGIVERLGPEDRVSVIQYDDSAQVVVASTVVDAEGKKRLLDAIDGIVDAGGTNLHDGMALGRDEVAHSLAAGRVNRVVLLSDGQANVGITDQGQISKIAGQAADKGIRITTIGLGVSYNEDLMEAIAENGRGNYYYVRDGAGLDAVFAGELKSLQSTVATNAELRLEPACAGVEIVEVYGYESRRDGSALIVPLADVAGGDHRKMIVRLRVPTGSVGAEGALTANLGWDDAVAGGHKTAQLALGVEVTKDQKSVEGSVDSSVMAAVEQVEAARAIREATAAYDRGDKDEAKRVLHAQKERTQQRANEYNMAPAATAPIYEEIDDMEGAVDKYDSQSGDGKGAMKKAKAGARDLSK